MLGPVENIISEKSSFCQCYHHVEPSEIFNFIFNFISSNNDLWKDGIHLVEDGKVLLASNFIVNLNNFYHTTLLSLRLKLTKNFQICRSRSRNARNKHGGGLIEFIRKGLICKRLESPRKYNQ